MNIKEIVEGMTAPQVAQVIKDNFNEVDKDKANKTDLNKSISDLASVVEANKTDLNKSISDLASVVEANKTDLTKKIDNNKEDTDEKLSELGSKLDTDKIYITPSETTTTAAINLDGSISVDAQWLKYGTVLSYSIEENQELYFSFVNTDYNANYLTVALYKDGTLVKGISYHEYKLQRISYALYNDFGADMIKLCVRSQYVDSVVAYALIETDKQHDRITGDKIAIDSIPLNRINRSAILSTSGYYKVLEPTSIDVNSGIMADSGLVGTDDTYFKAGKVSHYKLQPNRIYKLHFNVPGFTKVFIDGAIYKNGSPIVKLNLLNSKNESRDYVISTIGVDCDELLICENAYSTEVAIVSESADVFILNDSKSTLNPREKILSAAIGNDGGIETSEQYMKNGNVLVYDVEPNKKIYVSYIVPAFNKAYVSIALYKDDKLLKIISNCNGSKENREESVINNIGANILKVCVNTANVNSTTVYYNGDLEPLNDIHEIYEPCNGMDVYQITQEPNKFGVSQRIYIEGCAKNNNGKAVRLDDSQNIVVETNQSNGNDGTHELAFKVSADGYQSLDDKVTIHTKSATNAQGKQIKIMCVGDSLTDGGYPAVVEWIFNALNQDYGGNIKATMIGTKSEIGNISLGKYAFDVRGCNEGRSGAAISDYLRHFTTVTSTKEHWDMLGLGTMTRNGVKSRDYVPYEATSEQKELMRTTCHGWYDVEPTEEVWTWMKTKNWSEFFKNPFEYRGQTYSLAETYSATSADAIIAGMKLIFENKSGTWLPLPFYDYDTMVASNGQYAFSMNAYLDKYRTLEEDGVTRLTNGGTAVGSVYDYDVCKPTHVALIMSENDARWSASADKVVADLIKFADLISIYDSRIKITIGANRAYGAFNPQKYNDIGFIGDFFLVPRRLEAWQQLKSAIASTNYDLLPLYPMQSPIGAGGGRSFDTLSQKETLSWLGDLTHTLEEATSYLDRAYMVAAWVINTL